MTVNTKNTDEEILAAEMDVASGNITVTQKAKDLGITTPTYYRRLRQVHEFKKRNRAIMENVTITIEKLDSAANQILDELEFMLKNKGGYDLEKHDHLDVINTTIKLITGYRSALQKANVLIDARHQTVNVNVSIDALSDMWVRFVDPVLRKLGVDDDTIEKASGIVDAEFKEMNDNE